MERVLDQKGRWRNKTVAFHASEEENNLLNQYVRLSGLTKQDYIMSRLLNREVTVQGSSRVYKALRDSMAEIYQELQRIEKCSDISEELQLTIEMIGKIMNDMKEEN